MTQSYDVGFYIDMFTLADYPLQQVGGLKCLLAVIVKSVRYSFVNTK